MNPITQIESLIGRLVISDDSASALPLKKTVIQGQVTGPLISLLVTQQFTNPWQQPLELDYLFPLPAKAALVDFELHISGRLIKADIQELEQARQAYEEASRKGQRAGLLEQRRPNLFAIHLTNILPGESIQAAVRLQDRIKFEDGAFEVIFPMGLTPRYGTAYHPEEAAQTSAPLASVGEEIGIVEISLAVDAGTPVGNPTSSSHALHVTRLDERRLQVSLANEAIPDHDFVLRYALAGQNPAACLWTSHDQSEDTLLAALFPPALEENFQPAPRQFVFVLDRSGSMSGQPIAQARNALRACLRSLNPGDTFRILLFDDRLEWYSPDAGQVTQEEINRADSYLSQVDGRGGTEILPALEAVFDLPDDPGRTRYIVFLTDGAVSAEERALEQIRSRLGKARLFTFGIGPSVNRFLLDRMAQLGHGQAEFLQLDEDIEGAIIRFQDRVSFPMLTNLSLNWEGARGWDIFPPQLPDLYAGQPLEICARFQMSKPEAALVVHGQRAGKPVELRLALQPSQAREETIQRVWERAQIDHLLEQLAADPTSAAQRRQEIIGLALHSRLVTPYTAFVAIDQEIAVFDPSQRRIIHVAQPLPQGLDPQGFLPPPSPSPLYAASQASGAVPGVNASGFQMPSFLRKLASKPASSAKASFRVSESRSFPNALFDRGAPLSASQPPDQLSETILVTLDDHLRWLARTQQVDGSWDSSVERTAAALLAFVRHGHTSRKGDFRLIVRRAAAWLESQPAQGDVVYIKALTLEEIAQTTGQPAAIKSAAAARAAIDAPSTPLQSAILEILQGNSSPPFTLQPEIRTLDELRLAAVLAKGAPVSVNVFSEPQADLAHTWAAVLK
jgi:Ca-activated chloride channel homolog